jgi:hypothetical protein
MCRDCVADLRDLVEEGERFEGSNRQIVEIEEVDGDEVHLANHSPNPAFHLSHVGKLLHWLREDHFICGVSSGTTAIKTLVGEGKQAECKRCAQNASEIWALLNAMPDVQRDGTSGLAPNPQAR